MSCSTLTRDERQSVILEWCERAFGTVVDTHNRAERARRFLEEATELFQAVGLDEAAAHFVVSYVFGRPVGEPAQEIGGVTVTLYALAEILGLSVEAAEVAEIDRILSKPIEQFQRRQAEKIEAGL